MIEWTGAEVMAGLPPQLLEAFRVSEVDGIVQLSEWVAARPTGDRAALHAYGLWDQDRTWASADLIRFIAWLKAYTVTGTIGDLAWRRASR